MYSNAKYSNGSDGKVNSINVEINGMNCFVPLDPANSDYAAIMALVAEGQLTIAEAQ